MTKEQLEEYLVKEKRVAERELGCLMCHKYARCLFCAPAEEYPCAGAHERYMQALNQAVRLPAWLLPEPPIPNEPTPRRRASDGAGEPPSRRAERAAQPPVREERVPASSQTAAPQPAPPKQEEGQEEPVVTVSDIIADTTFPEREIPYLADLDLSVLESPEEENRAPAEPLIKRSISYRGSTEGVRLLAFRRKNG